MYISLHATILRLLRKKGKKEAIRKKRLVSISLHFESKITMHWPFLMVMISSYIEDLNKPMDKPIACILFFTTLKLNIVDKEKKTRCNSCGTTDQSINDQSFPNANCHLPK
jgi:hypothetical protein